MKSAYFFCNGKVHRINVLILWKHWFESGCAGEIRYMKIFLSHKKHTVCSAFFLSMQEKIPHPTVLPAHSLMKSHLPSMFCLLILLERGEKNN